MVHPGKETEKKKIKRERDDHSTALKCSRDPQDIQKGIGMCRDAFVGFFDFLFRR